MIEMLGYFLPVCTVYCHKDHFIVYEVLVQFILINV